MKRPIPCFSLFKTARTWGNLLLLNLTATLLAVLACAPAPAAPAAGSQAPAAPEGQATVKVTKHTTLGNILADGSGRTLYLFMRDERNKSNCSGSCAEAWPPLKVTGPLKAGEGAKAELLAATNRDDGSSQATYNGWPLYYFSGDASLGDAKGHNSQGFGGNWLALSPAGEPAKAASPSAGGDYGY